MIWRLWPCWVGCWFGIAALAGCSMPVESGDSGGVAPAEDTAQSPVSVESTGEWTSKIAPVGLPNPSGVGPSDQFRFFVEEPKPGLDERIRTGLRTGDGRGAIAPLREALRDDPENAELLYLIGATHAKLGQDPEAMAYLDRAIERLPKHAGARKVRGTLHLKRRDFSAAVEDFSAGLETLPNDGPMLTYRAAAWLNLRKGNESLEDASRALEAGPNAEASYVRCMARVLLRQFDEAETDLRAAIESGLDDGMRRQAEEMLRRGRGSSPSSANR